MRVTVHQAYLDGAKETRILFDNTWPDGLTRTGATTAAFEQYQPPGKWAKRSREVVHIGTPDDATLQNLKRHWLYHLAFILKVARAMDVIENERVL